MTIKHIAQYFLKSVLYIIGLIVLYALGVFLLPFIPVNTQEDDADEISIYILTNGVHTDIVCPLRHEEMDWSTILPLTDTREPAMDMNYVSFGWGDKGFYLNTPTWSELKLSTALKAAFWLSESAMHVTYYRSMSEDEHCRKIFVSRAQYKHLVNYILNTFDRANDQVIHIPTDMVYGDNDAFYEAKGSYNLFYTCNTWANAALKAAGQKAALWSATDFGIFRHYK